MLRGLAAVFAIVASVATASATWIVKANEIGRYGAIALLAVVSASLLMPRFTEKITRPLVGLGSGIDRKASGARSSRTGSFVIGSAIGLLWAPCAGPILGLVIAAAALNASKASSALLFVAFALGAATSLGIAMFAGSRVLQSMKRYAGADQWVLRILGVAALAGVFIIVMGWDRTLFAKGGIVQTAGAVEVLIRKLGASPAKDESSDKGESLDSFAAEEE